MMGDLMQILVLVFTLNNSFGKEVSLFSPRSSLVREASLCSNGTFVYNRASIVPIPFALRSNRYTDFGFVELKREQYSPKIL